MDKKQATRRDHLIVREQITAREQAYKMLGEYLDALLSCCERGIITPEEYGQRVRQVGLWHLRIATSAEEASKVTQEVETLCKIMKATEHRQERDE